MSLIRGIHEHLATRLKFGECSATRFDPYRIYYILGEQQ